VRVKPDPNGKTKSPNATFQKVIFQLLLEKKMSDESKATIAQQKTPLRTPQRLIRILIVVSAIYFIGFIWTFSEGSLGRLFIPFQWEMFFMNRSFGQTLNGRWYFYGTSISELLTNWLTLVATISAGYFSIKWIGAKRN
jgi:hypothetical protein